MLALRPRRGGVAWAAQRGDAGSRCVIDDADRWMDERRGEKDGPSRRFAEVEMGIG